MRNLRGPVLIAWFLCAVVSAATFYEAGNVFGAGWSNGSPLHLAGDTLNALLPLLFAVPAALIISRLPWNIIGWLLMLPAVLFNPLRRYVQALVNRRFYRQKYNAEQALAEFASVARGSTDVDGLTGMLVELVEKTLQPTQVSVYPRGEGKNSEKQ